MLNKKSFKIFLILKVILSNNRCGWYMNNNVLCWIIKFYFIVYGVGFFFLRGWLGLDFIYMCIKDVESFDWYVWIFRES